MQSRSETMTGLEQDSHRDPQFLPTNQPPTIPDPAADPTDSNAPPDDDNISGSDGRMQTILEGKRGVRVRNEVSYDFPTMDTDMDPNRHFWQPESEPVPGLPRENYRQS